MEAEVKIINGESHTQETAIKAHKGLVYMEANKFRSIGARNGMDIDDLISIGCMGLMKAFDNFDYDKYPIRFSTYALPTIRGELLRAMRDSNPGVKYSRGIKYLASQIRKNELMESTVEHIAKELSEKPSKVKYALDYIANAVPVSLDVPINIEGESELTIKDIDGESDDSTAIFVSEFINTLSDRDQTVITQRMLGMGQKEIGEMVGVSQYHVSRILKQIGKKYVEYSGDDILVKLNERKAREKALQ